MKKNNVTSSAPPSLPDPMAEVSSFFNDVAPTPLLPRTAQDTRKPVAAGATHYGRPSADVNQMADLRIRQWIMQQEEDNRRQEHKRLFSPPPKPS